MPDIGIKRGIVVDNADPEYRGRCKIFVPGIYPNEFSKSPENLPWAEPAMGIFGGGWKSSFSEQASDAKKTDSKTTTKSNASKTTTKSKFEETGICSVPHAGTNGDGAQVWVFFDSGDIRHPVYFAIAQTGPGWFSKHNNQHAIITDNVKLVVDEYETYSPIKNKNTNISDSLANDVSSADRSADSLKNDIANVGGVSGVQDSYDMAGGAESAFNFIENAGGSSAMQQISDTCSNGLNSLSNFISKSGGAMSLQSTLSDCGGYENIEAAVNGSTTSGASIAKEAIIANYGSMEEFQAQVAQVGGVSGLKSITDNFGGDDAFFDSLNEINGNDGLSSLAGMESKLGGSEAFKEWNDGFKNGAESVDAMISGKAAEDKLQEVQEQSKKKEDNTITKSTTYTQDATGFALFKTITEENRKCRVKIQIEAGTNVAVDLNIKGDVNMKIDGNLYREVTGNVYDTILGDHFVYRKKGFVMIQDGDEHKEILGKKQLKVSEDCIKILESGETQLITGNINMDFSGADIHWKTGSFNIDAKNAINLMAPKIGITGGASIDVRSHGNMTINSDQEIKMMAVNFSLNALRSTMVASSAFRIVGGASLDLTSYEHMKLISLDTRETPTSQTSQITIVAKQLALSSSQKTNIVMGGIITESIGLGLPAAITKTVIGEVTSVLTGSLIDTVTANRTINTNGLHTEVIAGNRLLTVGGADTETITGAYTMNTNGAYTVVADGAVSITGTASFAIVTGASVTMTASAGTVTFTGAKTTVVDTATGSGGAGTFAIVG